MWRFAISTNRAALATMCGVFPKVVLRAGVGLAVLAAIRLSAAAPIDTNALLQELQAIESKQKKDAHERLATLSRQFLDASRKDAAAEKVYLEAIRNVRFDTKAAGDNNRFQDWKKDHRNMLNNKAFQAALMLHLRYVGISLEVAGKPKDAPMPYQEIMAYLRDFFAARQQYAQTGLSREQEQVLRDFYERPIDEGVIAQGFFLSADLQKLTQGGDNRKWESHAGNWRSILERGVRQPLREARDPQLLDTWQFQIDATRKDFEGNRNNLDNANLTQHELPRLQWRQAGDMLLLGQNDLAIATMAQIVRTYPNHPDILNWIAQLKDALAASPAETAPAPTPQ